MKIISMVNIIKRVRLLIAKKSNLILFINLIVSLSMLSGCWNYGEIENKAIVAGAAIDKSNNGEGYLVTVEIIDINMSGSDVEINSKLVESEGQTLFDAVRNVIKVSGRKLYWSHAEVFIIGQDIAKEGINQIIDWIHRDAEIRMSIHILIPKTKTAKEIITKQSLITKIRTAEIMEAIKSQKSLSKGPTGEGYIFIDDLTSEGISAVLPTIGMDVNADQKILELSGLAIFKGDKLIGVLDEEDTKYYLFIRDKIKGGLIVDKQRDQDPKPNVTLEILKNKTKIKPIYEGGQLSVDIHTKTEIALGEYEKIGNNYNKDDTLFIKKTEDSLESNIKKTVEKLQNQFGADIFGFGKIIKAEMPDIWKSVSDDWENNFNHLDIYVNSEIKVKNTGLVAEPIVIGK